MFELMIGTDAVRRRTQRSFGTEAERPSKRPFTLLRVTTAAGLRALADRVEPVTAGRPSEVAGAYSR
jgi:hypothetical protein